MSGQQPTAFFSYARWDDEHDGGYLSRFRKRLAEEVQAQTGDEFLIFQDQIDVAWGQDWQRRITDSLNETVFFIPVLTPTFFTRPACRQEASLFLEREQAQGRGGLILPVYYIASTLLDDEAERAKDPLAQSLQAIERADWRELRLVPFNRRKVQEALETLAGQLHDALRRYRAAAAPAQDPSPQTPSGLTGAAPRQRSPSAVQQTDRPPEEARPVSVIAGPAVQGQARPNAGETVLAPPDADALINIGVALGQTGDANGAVDQFRRAIALAPTDARLRTDIGVALAQMGDLNGAAAQFSQAIALAPDSAAAHNGLGMALARMGNLVGAATQFGQAVAVDPTFGKGLINLGMALGQMGDMGGALQRFRQAASLAPTDTDALISIGVALGQMGDLNAAAERFRQAVALDPASAAVHNSLGMALWQVGDLNGAAGQFGQALSLDPDFAKARNNLGMVLGQMGDVSGAFAQFRQAIATETNSPPPLFHSSP